MDNITKGLSELSAEDSGSSQDNKVGLDCSLESSQSESATSADNGGTPLNDPGPSSSICESSSGSQPIQGEQSITTRSSKKVRPNIQCKDNNPHPTSATMDTEDAHSGFVVEEHSHISTRSSSRRGASVNKNQTMKFMENFDPERSNRERKKLTRQISSSGKRKPTLYDEKGVMIASEVDLCDCLDEDCLGCHFPCPKCHSNKCGHECRQNRRWTYEEIWVEGTNKIITNPLL